jgi:ferritin-like protein
VCQHAHGVRVCGAQCDPARTLLFHASMASNQLHEAAEDLSTQTRDMHRALVSLMEELEAVDWYAQRIEATHDEQLARVLAHNRDEEKEHACMTLEWIRRHDAKFDTYLRRFLFSSGAIAAEEGAEQEHAGVRDDGRAPTLGIGSLRGARQNGKQEANR